MKVYTPEAMVRVSRYQNYFPTLPEEIKSDIYARMRELIEEVKVYGDMKAFVSLLRRMGYEKVELIDTTNGMFMSPWEAKWMALSGSALLAGKK